MLVAGFIPTGLVKLLGRRFTLMPAETPIGAFFEAMYQTGGYWQFLGFSQVLAGSLLLIPRFAHLGALLLVPIMVNIFVITVALGFKGTPVVTELMLLAVVYVCAWDYHRLRGLFTEHPWGAPLAVPTLPLDGLENVGFSVFAASLLAVFGATRSFGSASGAGLWFVGVGILAGLITLVRFLTHGRHLRA